MNIFGTILTYPAPSANYRGESEENRTVIQKVTHGRFEYAVISPEAIRNALRETLAKYGLPTNRERLHNEDQLAVRFKEYPDPTKFADDFFFGYLLALGKKEREKAEAVRGKGYKIKRDSVIRMNLAMALEPYRHDAIFSQSPLNVDSPWQNAGTSALLHRETTVTAFQYPFAINVEDCRSDDPNLNRQYKSWLSCLFKALSELNDVAGNHSRSYFEMAPASIVLRLTPSLVAGYETYGFRPDGAFPEIVEGILAGDYAGQEFYLGGRLAREIVAAMTRKVDGRDVPVSTLLEQHGAHLFRTPAQALDAVAAHSEVCSKGFLGD